MENYRYILEPYKGIKTRYVCPGCNLKEFSRYIDSVSGEQINRIVGRCNRENNCGYHYTPKQYFQDQNIPFDNIRTRLENRSSSGFPQKPRVTFIPIEFLNKTLAKYEDNNFVKFLICLFGIEVAKQLIEKYFIGTSNHWPGATVFWQVDINGNIRTGKIMLYSPSTGSRLKKPFNHIQWVHKVIKSPDFNLNQCLFGEHLLFKNVKPVIIVESEKTAIISSVYWPDYIWLATGGKNNFNSNICKVLKGQKGAIYPDIGAFNDWSKIAQEIPELVNFKVSDFLELNGDNYQLGAGDDFADYFVIHST